MRVLVICLFVLTTLSASADKIVISHRGASGYLPEHTLEAYALAYGMGADYIEPDLVRTKDGRFIALHDIHLQSTTNVEEVFPERKREDGQWYAADFTLEEIKQLRAEERLEGRFPAGKSDFELPTFEEVIELVQGLNESTGRSVGIYPELKEPRWHEREGLAMEEEFLKIIRQYKYDSAEASIFVQCFEEKPLQKLREQGMQCPAVFLMSKGAKTDEARLNAISSYAQGIGPDKQMVADDPALVQRAHGAGLVVHPYTIRRAGRAYNDGVREELQKFYVEYGVDGVFTDYPDDAAIFLRSLDN